MGEDSNAKKLSVLLVFKAARYSRAVMIEEAYESARNCWANGHMPRTQRGSSFITLTKPYFYDGAEGRERRGEERRGEASQHRACEKNTADVKLFTLSDAVSVCTYLAVNVHEMERIVPYWRREMAVVIQSHYILCVLISILLQQWNS